MCLTRALISMHMGTHSGEGSPVLPIQCGTPKALPLPTATATHPADTWAPWHHPGSGTVRSRGRNMLHLRSHSAGHSRVRKSPSCSLWAEEDPESVYALTATRPGAPQRISECPGRPGLYPCPVGPLQGTVPGVCSDGCWNSGSLEHPRAGMVKSAQQAWHRWRTPSPWWFLQPPCNQGPATSTRNTPKTLQHSPSSQAGPERPGGQRQRPVVGSQGAPPWQLHLCRQPCPKEPGAHSKGCRGLSQSVGRVMPGGWGKASGQGSR